MFEPGDVYKVPKGGRPESRGFIDLERRGLYVRPNSIQAWMIADGALDYGLSFYAQVNTYTDTTHFKASGLAGKGAGFFKPTAGAPYEIYVVQADAAAPEGQITPVVAYTTADGTFQHAAFSGGNLAVGDIVLIIHPLIASLGTKATAAATGAVTTTDYIAAYIKQLVTQLLATDVVVDDIHTDVATVDGMVDQLLVELAHRSYIFPDLSSNIDLTCTFTSGEIDTFGTWAEITDSGATTMTSIAASHALRVSALRIRTSSVADVLYVIEMGYGPDTDNVTIVDVHEFGSGTKKIDSDEQVRFRAPEFTQGQKVYYRMKTEDNANATVTIGLRYHYH